MDVNNFAPHLIWHCSHRTCRHYVWLSVRPSVIMLCGMLKYGTSCYLAIGLLCCGCSAQIRYFFLINAYKGINQSVDSKQDGKSMGGQTDGRMQQWMFGHNENSHADFKVCDIRLSYDASVMFTCSFHLFSFSISVTANMGRAVCDLTRTACNVVSLLGLYSVECLCRPKVSCTETLTLVTWYTLYHNRGFSDCAVSM